MPDSSSNVTTIAVAAIGAIGAIAAAAFANWDKIVRADPVPAPQVAQHTAETPAAVEPSAPAAPTAAKDDADSKMPPLRLANLVGEWKSTITTREPVFGSLRLRAEGALVRFSAVAAKPCSDAAGCAYAVMLDPERATLSEGRRAWQLPRMPLDGATWAPPGTTAVSMTVTRNIAEPRKLYAHVTLYGGQASEYDDVFVR
jgi:hypothetical protein